MTQEDKQLLLKDLCMRLPYGLWIDDGYSLAIHIDYSDVHFENYFNGILNGDVKPYLRPLSSMTEEERLYFHRNSARVQILVDEEKAITKPFYGYTVHLLDWLNTHHFDYRGLIPKGLALEAPEGMYE